MFKWTEFSDHLPVSCESGRCWSGSFRGFSRLRSASRVPCHPRAEMALVRPVFFLIFANILIKVSVQKRKNGTLHCSIASHVGIMLHMMPWFDLLEWCSIIFRTDYTVSTITLAWCLAYSVVCLFCLWARQCNSVPTMRHHHDGSLHTYAWIWSVNNHLPICMLTIGTELMRGMRIHCAQALQCEEK